MFIQKLLDIKYFIENIGTIQHSKMLSSVNLYYLKSRKVSSVKVVTLKQIKQYQEGKDKEEQELHGIMQDILM